MITRKGTLFDQGMSCVILLVLGISNTSFVPPALRGGLDSVLLLIMILVALTVLSHEAARSKKDIQREQKDERNQMILERAVWYCRQAEDWILLGLYAMFTLFLHKYEVANVILWILTGRSLLSFAIRWWLNRKY